MKAVISHHHLPLSNPLAFQDVDLPKPEAEGRDILVSVKAVSVNPVDAKIRLIKAERNEKPSPLGWDASGVVDSVGPGVTLFKPGDEVYYAGDITRDGSNSEFQLVDERVVGFKPKTLTFAEAAALPLTSITAFETLFDKLGVDLRGGNKDQTILIVGAGGGVGSIAIQLAKLAGLVVIATASRPETEEWVRELGANHVVNHRHDIVKQVRSLGFDVVDHIAILNDMRHWSEAVELVRPRGAIAAIELANLPMPMEGMKAKAASLHWENIFARVTFEMHDMIEHHNILDLIAAEVDAARLRSTLSRTLDGISAKNIRDAHLLIQSGSTKGKIVLYRQ